MILVGQYDSPVTRRVAIALHHYAIAFSRDTRSIFGDADAVSKVSTLTRIPALILDNGEVLIDSAAILDHLDSLAPPGRALVPPHGDARRHVLQATALAQGTLEKIAAVVYERHFHPPAHISLDWQNRCLSQAAAGLAELERRGRHPWFCGENFSHADVMTAATIAYADLRLPEIMPSGSYPNLRVLARACEALPAFKAAAISENETMPKP